mgnify:FL=1
MNREPPKATVIRTAGKNVRIECPYCNRTHWHTVQTHGPQRFSPQCGLRLNPEQRATGYQFNTYTAMEKHK